jgi:oligopeptide/dipeptide ABC transporter ATP-binding protein
LGLTYVFISHDLGMVRHLADRIAVMYLGRIVELGGWAEVSDRPRHPYARALQAAAPPSHRGTDGERGPSESRELGADLPVRGEPPDPAAPPPGCRFHPRCPLAEPSCHRTEPVLADVGPGHEVACPVTARAEDAAPLRSAP